MWSLTRSLTFWPLHLSMCTCVFQTSRCFSAGSVLSVGWMLQALQPHPHLVIITTETRFTLCSPCNVHPVFLPQLSFVGYQAKQVALALSDLQESALSPLQAVVLFQRCRLLLACLQHSSHLAQHLRSHFREEFRFVPSTSELAKHRGLL